MKVVLVIIPVAAVAFAAFNVHTCDYCNELFFGKANSTETRGDLRSDCYISFGGMEDVFGADILEGFLN